MIRILRGPEPGRLADIRSSRMPTALAAFNAATDVRDLLTGYGDKLVKKALSDMQHAKCAFCEVETPFSSSPIEHFRPKAEAWRHLPGEPSQVDRERYWWLAWTWTNLLFSCPRCNDRGHKANYFPLERASELLAAPRRPATSPLPDLHFTVQVERPLLLDPTDTSTDPLDHIRWAPVQRSLPRSRWTWSPTPHGGSARGAATIRILKLAELSDRVGRHLASCVLPSVEEIDKHIAEGRQSDAHERWAKLLRSELAPERQFRSATWCAIELWVPPTYRRSHGLADPVRP